ncbi:stimulated by retinoic acid gene 6 protein-like isoform X1 [Oculina patagonica]
MSTEENDCIRAFKQQAVFDRGCLAPALVIMLVLASLKRRTKFKLEWFDGRPGLLIPVDFLAGQSNRWTIAATFGATASTMISLIGTGKSGNNLIISESPWVKIVDILLVVLVYGILYYPFFVCLTTEYKTVGSLFGFLYGALRLSFQLATQIRCCIVVKGSDVGQLYMIVQNLPTNICLIFIVTRFAVLAFLRLRQKLFQSSTESTGGDSCSSPLVKESDIIHVKWTLGQGPPLYPEEGKWFLKLLYYFYKPRADFKFSTQLISTVFLAVIAIFEVFLSELILSEALLEGSEETQWLRVVKGCLYGAISISALISLIGILHFLKCHRDHVLQLCRGQRDLMQNVRLSPSAFVGRSLSFTGYQIAYALWGFIIWTLLFFVLFLVPAILLTYKDSPLIKWLLDIILSIAKGSLPSAVLAIVLWVFQRVFLSRWVFRDRDYPNLTVTIDNRRLFCILSYMFVFLNVIVGLFACLIRILKGMILGVFFISRIDRTCLMQGFQRSDKGFVAYLGFLHVLVAHRHPAMLVFCQLLIDRNKLQQSEEATEMKPAHPSNIKQVKTTTAYSREIRHPRLSQKAVNRWMLAVTLLRNPSLLQYRRQWYSSPIAWSEADTASITVLVQ